VFNEYLVCEKIKANLEAEIIEEMKKRESPEANPLQIPGTVAEGRERYVNTWFVLLNPLRLYLVAGY
jgi:hypothetical protein